MSHSAEDYSTACNLYDNREYKKAKEILLKLWKSGQGTGSESKYLCKLGDIERKKNNMTKARRCYQQAHEMNKLHFDTNYQFGSFLSTCHEFDASVEDKNNRLKSAVYHYEQCLKVKCHHPMALYYLSLCYQSLKQFDKCIQHIELSIFNAIWYAIKKKTQLHNLLTMMDKPFHQLLLNVCQESHENFSTKEKAFWQELQSGILIHTMRQFNSFNNNMTNNNNIIANGGKHKSRFEINSKMFDKKDFGKWENDKHSIDREIAALFYKYGAMLVDKGSENGKQYIHSAMVAYNCGLLIDPSHHGCYYENCQLLLIDLQRKKNVECANFNFEMNRVSARMIVLKRMESMFENYKRKKKVLFKRSALNKYQTFCHDTLYQLIIDKYFYQYYQYITKFNNMSIKEYIFDQLSKEHINMSIICKRMENEYIRSKKPRYIDPSDTSTLLWYENSDIPIFVLFVEILKEQRLQNECLKWIAEFEHQFGDRKNDMNIAVPFAQLYLISFEILSSFGQLDNAQDKLEQALTILPNNYEYHIKFIDLLKKRLRERKFYGSSKDRDACLKQMEGHYDAIFRIFGHLGSFSCFTYCTSFSCSNINNNNNSNNNNGNENKNKNEFAIGIDLSKDD